ncbi:MAG: Rrf2 family transcriptional regulator [Opitutaceae bacterium]|nr:Rrf2 family transcriptional regulator [Opitutaceae bacterium]
MKLSKKGEYALRALIELGIAQEVGRELVQVTELAGSKQIPIKFLEQIMVDLRGAGWVESRRGKFGGYRLRVPARSLPIGQIVRAIEGPLAPIGCVSQSAYEPCSCPDEDHCGLRMLMMDVRNAIAGILDRYTLADVVEVTLRKMRRDGLPLPYADSHVAPRPVAVPVSAARRRSAAAPASPIFPARLAPVEGLIKDLFEDYTI